MKTKIKATLVAVALTGAMLVSAPAAQAQQAAPLSMAASATSDCPWWVANGYWKVIWYWGTGQCSVGGWWRS